MLILKNTEASSSVIELVYREEKIEEMVDLNFSRLTKI